MHQDIALNNKLIAKNTIYMYIRMGVVMLVQLYTSRIVLNSLGFEDYGIYNVVGSFIVAFTFISSPLGAATQRYLNFELGKKEKSQTNVIFNLSFYSYLFLSISLFIIIELVGEWYIHNKMQMPHYRMAAAEWVFHLSLLSLILGLIKTPFESSIIAFEKMSFYAYLGIFEVILKLLNAFSLEFIMVDKLKLYAVNQFIISFLVLIGVYIFCYYNFKTIRLQNLRKNWNPQKFRELLSFSGWNLFGAIANMTADQGLNILLNYFYGVVLNSAMGIANQINVSVNQFVSNFQTAFRPQLVKCYASEEICRLNRLVINTSKYSFFLLFAIACPICVNMHFLLELWLKHVPDYTVIFCILIIIFSLISTLSAPLWMTVHATGKIKKYQIVISCVILMNVLLSYIFLNYGYPPQTILIIKCLLCVCTVMIRLYFVCSLIDFSLSDYIKETICPVLIVSTISFLTVYLFVYNIHQGWLRIGITIMIFSIIYSLLVLFVGLTKKERYLIKKMICVK